MIPDSSILILAHDVGGPKLPFPLSYALVGMVWVLSVVFVALMVAWRTPKFDPTNSGRAIPEWLSSAVDSPVCRTAAAVLVLLIAVWVAVAAFFGPQDAQNPLRGVVYVLLWVGLVPVSLAAGPVWRAVSPVRTVWKLVNATVGTTHGERVGLIAYPSRLGYWPAAMGLFAMAWLQLASPNLGTFTTVKLWLLTYVVAMIAGAIIFGQRWFARADPFEAYSVVVSRLSPFRRNRETGHVVVGNPLDHLPSMPVRPGTLAMLAILLGALGFDSLSALPRAENFVYDVAAPFPVDVQPVVGTVVRTSSLSIVIVLVGATFWVAAQCVGGMDRRQRRQLPGMMAHTLIPMIVGYTLAHHLSDLIERGQRTLIRLADPLDRGWRLLGLDQADGTYWLSQNPGVLSVIQASLVMAGHLVAVVAFHDRALRVLPARHRATGQLAMIVTMTGYAFLGLYLMFGA